MSRCEDVRAVRITHCSTNTRYFGEAEGAESSTRQAFAADIGPHLSKDLVYGTSALTLPHLQPALNKACSSTLTLLDQAASPAEDFRDS